MDSRLLFSPAMTEIFRPQTAGRIAAGDRRDGSVYVYTREIIQAVKVAQVTNRPVLVRGASGNGKSSLARNVARWLGRRYYEAVVTSRTQARDLLWEVDLLRRLSDANLRNKEVGEDLTPYIKPGVLWWAFDRDSGRRRGKHEAEFNPGWEARDPNLGDEADQAVVLIDEIDKADPDVPNNLLVPLGSLQFQVEETLTVVETEAERAPLVFITTNGERELPAAFLRRCIDIRLPDPDVDRLVAIGQAHFPAQPETFLREIANRIQPPARVGAEGPRKGEVRAGVAEFLDTVRACIEIPIIPGSKEWEDLLSMTFLKGRGDDRGG